MRKGLTVGLAGVLWELQRRTAMSHHENGRLEWAVGARFKFGFQGGGRHVIDEVEGAGAELNTQWSFKERDFVDCGWSCGREASGQEGGKDWEIHFGELPNGYCFVLRCCNSGRVRCLDLPVLCYIFLSIDGRAASAALAPSCLLMFSFLDLVLAYFPVVWWPIGWARSLSFKGSDS